MYVTAMMKCSKYCKWVMYHLFFVQCYSDGSGHSMCCYKRQQFHMCISGRPIPWIRSGNVFQPYNAKIYNASS